VNPLRYALLLLALLQTSCATPLVDTTNRKYNFAQAKVLRCTFKSSKGQSVQIVTNVDPENNRMDAIRLLIGEGESEVYFYSDAYVRKFKYDRTTLDIDAAVVPGVNAGPRSKDGALKAHFGPKSDSRNAVSWKNQDKGLEAHPDIGSCALTDS
jgi:hypothetical protein